MTITDYGKVYNGSLVDQYLLHNKSKVISSWKKTYIYIHGRKIYVMEL